MRGLTYAAEIVCMNVTNLRVMSILGLGGGEIYVVHGLSTGHLSLSLKEWTEPLLGIRH